jgi:hypothetical protein
MMPKMLCIIKKIYNRQKYHLQKNQNELKYFFFLFAQSKETQIAGAANPL